VAVAAAAAAAAGSSGFEVSVVLHNISQHKNMVIFITNPNLCAI